MKKHLLSMLKFITCCVLVLSAIIGKAQSYADQLIASGPCDPIVALLCPSGVENPGNAVDLNPDNYALLKTNLGVSLIQSTAFIELGFTQNGSAGSDIAIIVEKIDQSLNIDVIDNITIVVFDAVGNEVVRRSDLSLQDVGVMGGSSSRQILKFTTPLGNYTIGKVRIELEAAANVLQSLALYGASYNLGCPAIQANNLLGSENCLIPQNAVDTDTATFATFTLPASLGNTASITLGFDNLPVSGDYVGFEIARNSTLLQLGVIDNLSIIIYGKDSVELFRKSDFSTADLIALDDLAGVLGPLFGMGGTLNPRYIIGFSIPSTVVADVARLQLELNSTIGLAQDLRVYNGFYFSQVRGIGITADKVGIINNSSVTLTADSGFTNYTWSNGATGRTIFVSTPGVYTVTVTRFDGCLRTGSINVRNLDCGLNGRIFADSVSSFGNCEPQVAIVCPSGVTNPGFAVDSNPNSFALLSSSIGLSIVESTAFLDLSFEKSGDPGSDIGIIIQAINQNVNADVVENLSIYVYDEAGIEVLKKSNVSLSDVGLLSGTGGRAVLTVRTPIGNYRIKRVRVELVGVANVLQDLAVYGMYYDCACPPIAADTLISSTNTINPELAVDVDNSNFAIMSLPLSIGQQATLEVGFSKNVTGGDYVGFQVEFDNDLLSLGLVDSIEISVYDENGNLRDSYSDFVLTDIVAAEQLGGTLGGLLAAGGSGTAPSVIGFQSDTGNYTIASIRLTINSSIGALVNLRVYNAFSLSQLMGVLISVSDTISCKGNPITLTAPLGYDAYLWSTGDTTQSITVTEPGQYSVTIFRTDGCALTGSYFILSRDFNASFVAVQPTCGQNNGSVKATVSGGSGAYNYNWSNGATTDSISNLSIGTYTVIITDLFFGCTDTFSFFLANDSSDFVGYVRNADCGQSNGAIFVTLPTGAKILWSTGDTTAVISNLSAGDYTATVTFTSGCVGSMTFTVLDFANFNLSASVTDANCISDNGAIDLTVGVPGTYSYLWSTDETTEDIMNLAPDLYSVVVTNAQTGCQDGLFTTVSDIGGPIVSLVDLKEETCARLQNGRIEIAYEPADSNFTVQWSNGTTTKANEFLGPGIYDVTVSNGLGCQTVKSYELVARDSIRVNLFTLPSVCEPPYTGLVVSAVTGGRLPYEYLYNTGDTTQNLSNVAPGNYALQIIDFNNCVVSQSAIVTRDAACDNDTTDGGGPDDKKAISSQLVTPNGDGFNDTWKTDLINTYPTNLVEIYTRDGVLVFEKKNYRNDWGGTYKTSDSILPDGTYFWVFNGKGSRNKEFRGFLVIKL